MQHHICDIVRNHLKWMQENNKFIRSGIFQLNYADCPTKYISQAGRTFKTNFREHIHKTKIFPSHFAHRLTVVNMLWVHVPKKGPFMNTLEKFNVYTVSRQGMHMNKTYADIINPIYDVILQSRWQCIGIYTKVTCTHISVLLHHIRHINHHEEKCCTCGM
jgi:hypothetical protein